MTSDDVKYLLSSHMVVADGEINVNELNILNKLAVSKDIIEEHKKILSDDDNQISIDKLLAIYKSKGFNDENDIIYHLCKIAHIDGYYDKAERKLLRKIALPLNVNENNIKNIEEKLDKLIKPVALPRWSDNLQTAFLNLIDVLNEKEEQESGSKYELLSGGRFKRKIKQIAIRSREDLEFADQEIDRYNDFLKQQYKEIERTIVRLVNNKSVDSKTNTEEFNEIFSDINSTFKEKILVAISNSREALNKKKRTIDFFSIVFMGRTKSGKSTFHKVVTHDDADDIGVGKLRTTRFNRSWYWENLRIVDTPGIAAPGEGGKEDEMVARTIIDEADLVCYIVTNDAIQEREFNFLKGLKEQSKPLFIILNVKENINEPARWRRFFKKPLKWKHNTGHKSIQGHIERIKDVIGNNYNTNAIEIIPLQLLAAQIAHTKKDLCEDELSALKKGSNISEYVAKIKETVFKTGNLKKSQNILDGCNYHVHTSRKEIETKRNFLIDKSKTLETNKKQLLSFIHNETNEKEWQLKEVIKSGITQLDLNARRFSDDNYEGKGKDIQEKWRKYPSNTTLFNRLNLEVGEVYSDLSKSIQDRITEFLEDLDFNDRFEFGNQHIDDSIIINWRRGVRIACSTGGLVVALVWHPVGWAALALGTIGYYLLDKIPKLFASKDKKRKKAKEKCYMQLSKANDEFNDQLNEKIIIAYNSFWDTKIDEIKNKLESYIFGINDIIDKMTMIIEQSKKTEQEFNKVFALRLLSHINKIDKRNSSLGANENLIKKITATKDYEKSSMVISVPFKITNEEQQYLTSITQTYITFIKNHDTKQL